MTFLVEGTPVDDLDDRLSVKREDLCSPYPGPAFAKIRGVYAHIAKRPEETIGVLDTFHSKAGWAVAYVARALGKQSLDFYPRYRADGEELREGQREARENGAELYSLAAGRSAILYHRARKESAARGAYLMPNALKLPETVEEVSAEVLRTPNLDRYDHLVISVSSGTIAAGVLAGFARAGAFPRVTLHAGYSRSPEALRRYVASKVPRIATWPSGEVEIVDEGYAYKEPAKGLREPPPFPCNPYYDLKAWKWLREGAGRERTAGARRVLFWNIGA